MWFNRILVAILSVAAVSIGLGQTASGPTNGDEVFLYVAATDKYGRSALGLAKEHFTIREGKNRYEITSLVLKRHRLLLAF